MSERNRDEPDVTKKMGEGMSDPSRSGSRTGQSSRDPDDDGEMEDRDAPTKEDRSKQDRNR